ncbi:hypothetical protein PsYK624_073890 [Phanerochaete sordida]|uniref:F-box domain-containing protein n=1 Tax=Phanerochaete sordida TaxID=48140 RepID=A0A9P3LDG9_9APHY|nr:hypothetical protein PsYK624_073890 [Phanerochaete sordida]
MAPLLLARLRAAPSTNSPKSESRFAKPNLKKSLPYLPIEILDYIVAFMLLDHPFFPTIENFSLASRQFRLIAFRQYFSLLVVRSKAHWATLCQILGVRSWARTLDAVSTALYANTSHLASFTHLHTLTIDFYAEGPRTHHTSAARLLAHAPASLTHLELRLLPSLTPPLLALAAAHCPHLRTLVLRVADRLAPDCCWNCYDDAGSAALHSPVPNEFCSAEHLAHAFGAALAPLHVLRHLELGVHLSPLPLFHAHLAHAGDFRFPPPPGAPPPFGPDACAACAPLAGPVRDAEVRAAAVLAAYLPSVEGVTWATWFAKRGREGDDVVRGTTRIRIVRDEE